MTNQSQTESERKAKAFEIVTWAIDNRGWSTETALEFIKQLPDMSNETLDSYYKDCQEAKG